MRHPDNGKAIRNGTLVSQVSRFGRKRFTAPPLILERVAATLASRMTYGKRVHNSLVSHAFTWPSNRDNVCSFHYPRSSLEITRVRANRVSPRCTVAADRRSRSPFPIIIEITKRRYEFFKVSSSICPADEIPTAITYPLIRELRSITKRSINVIRSLSRVAGILRRNKYRFDARAIWRHECST